MHNLRLWGRKLRISDHRMFRMLWWSVNLLVLAGVVSLGYASVREYSVRRYLDGFSDAIVPEPATPEQTVEAILLWMRSGPPRSDAAEPSGLSSRDPKANLNYRQLLSVCGTATNAFLNLARSSDLSARRLLLLTADQNTKHVVAEVLIDGRWIIADPTYRVVFRDAQGRLLTRRDMQNPAVFAEAISTVPGYPREYSYELFAHVRLAKLPLLGTGLGHTLDRIYPNWEEAVDWSLLLERESFLALVISGGATLFLMLQRFLLAWYADNRLQIPRFRLRQKIFRAGAAFLSTPEIKQ